MTKAKERRETLKELKENPVEFTFKNHGILHEIKKREIDNYIKTSNNFKNINLDDFKKEDQQKYRLRAFTHMKRELDPEAALNHNGLDIRSLEKLFRRRDQDINKVIRPYKGMKDIRHHPDNSSS